MEGPYASGTGYSAEPDPYEICPDIDNPDNCPKKDYKVKIEKISLSRVRGETIYTIKVVRWQAKEGGRSLPISLHTRELILELLA